MHFTKLKTDLFYGWIIVAVCFLVIALVFGVRLSFGLFFDALTRPGPDGPAFAWTRASTAGVFSTTMIVFTVTGALFGWMLDRLGPRWVFTLGLLLLGSGLVMTSRMESLWQFTLYYGIWTGTGITMLGLAIQAATISRWFGPLQRRGLAIGIAFSGTGAGILVLAPLLEYMIRSYGWRNAYLFLAVLVFLLLPLVLIFLRNEPPPQPNSARRAQDHAPKHASARSRAVFPLHWSYSAAAHTPAYWLILVGGACSLFTLRMVSVHQVAHFVDNGIPRVTAASIIGSAGLVTALAFIAFGQLSDQIGRTNAFHISTLFQISALVLLWTLRPGASWLFLYGYALLWGIGEGGRSGLLTAIMSDAFPGTAQGIIIGSLGAFFGLGSAIGSWWGGYAYDHFGSYSAAFALAAAASLVATLAILGANLLRAPQRDPPK